MSHPSVLGECMSREFDWEAFKAWHLRLKKNNPKQEVNVMGKKYEDYTLTDIKSNCGFFTKQKYCPLPDANEAENVVMIKDTINYIETMGEMLQIPVSMLKVMTNFTEDNRLLTDRARINERMVGLKQAFATPEWKKSSLTRFTPVITEKFVEKIESDITNQRQSALSNIESAQSDLDSYLRTLHNLNMKFGSGGFSRDRTVNHLETVMQAVASNDFYEFLAIGNEVIWLLTKPIGLRLFNPSQGLDVTRDMGQLLVKVPLGAGEFQVLKGINNYGRDFYWHPHVNSAGSICWGNVSNQVVELTTQGDYDKLLVIIQNLLCTYNADSPYQALQAYPEKTDRYTNPKVEQMIQVTESEVASFELRHPNLEHEIIHDLATDIPAQERLKSLLELSHYRNMPKLRVKDDTHYKTGIGRHWRDVVLKEYYENESHTPYNLEGDYDYENETTYTMHIRRITGPCSDNRQYQWNTDGTKKGRWDQLEWVETPMSNHPLYTARSLN